jgi:hypothetical protein
MVGLGVPVGGGMAVGGVVTAADVTAPHAESQMDPPVACAQAVLAPGAGRRDGLHSVEVATAVSHQSFLSTVRTGCSLPWGPFGHVLPSSPAAAVMNPLVIVG